MASKNSDFLELIKNQRSLGKTEIFSGTFLDYLVLVKENHSIIQLAHKRLYNSLKVDGMKTVDVDSDSYRPIFNGEKIRVYKYFENEFFGNEQVISRIMRYLKSASLKGEESRQVLLLMGPVGAGKSALI